MDARTQTNLWDSRIVPAAALTVYFVVCSLLLHPYDNLPFVDDWTYAWSVEQLLKTGELRISDWSAHYPLAQILWGALFSLPFGFSFSTLRVSTVVLAWLKGRRFRMPVFLPLRWVSPSFWCLKLLRSCHSRMDHTVLNRAQIYGLYQSAGGSLRDQCGPFDTTRDPCNEMPRLTCTA